MTVYILKKKTVIESTTQNQWIEFFFLNLLGPFLGKKYRKLGTQVKAMKKSINTLTISTGILL